MAFRLGLCVDSLARPFLTPATLHTASNRYSTTSAATAAISQPRDNLTLTLPDGRRLSYAEYGQPDGKPLLYFHGYPASRREVAPINKEITERGIRVISIDRPGLGGSTFQPGRTLRDWLEDVKVLTDLLGLKRFAVLGSSGGGPYAVACALGLPRDRLSVAGVYAGAPPWEVGAHHVSKSRHRLAYLAERWPRLLKGLMMGFVKISRWLIKRAWVQKKINAWLEVVFKKAAEAKGEPVEELTPERMAEIRDQLTEPFLDHFDQGADGFVQETQILVRPWGFAFEDVKGRVQIYHGTKDSNASIEMMRILAERLPNCDLQEFEKDDHYTMGSYMVDAMDRLVSDDESKRV